MLIHDLLTCPTADIVDPFHVLYFYLPRRTLDALSDEMRAPAIEVMQAQPRTAGAMDPVVEHLMLTVLPALDSPQEMNDVFAEHLTLALSAHVAAKYGGMRPAQARARGGLSAKLQRRAMEMLDANLDGSVSLTQLAAECGLSVRHFARAFKQSTGMPPHRYLLTRRIESARAMVLESNLSLTEVALACGFSDQSHLTRVFTASVGISPGALRRARHSR